MADDKNKNPDDARSWDDWPESGQFARRDDVAAAPLPSFKAKYNQDWGLQDGETGSDDLSGNKNNRPVPLRKGSEPTDGWQTIASDTAPSASGDFGKGSGGEKR
jgi:hypothetical protein